MSLSVVQFYSLKPHLPFRYKTEWFLGFWDAKQKEILSYAVTSVTLPKIEIENNNGFSYFGNGFINMPTFSPGTRKLEITFEETDYMLVSRTIDELVKRSYSNKPYYITIAITQFNEHFHKGITKGYICHLASYEEPQFKRDGQAQAITVSASFIVDTVIDSFTADKAVSGNVNVRQAGEYNTNINTLVIDDQNVEFKFGNLRIPVDTTQFGNSVLKQIINDKSGRNETYDALHDDFKKSGVIKDGMTSAQKIQATQKWLKEKGVITRESQGLCATGNSVVHALAYDVDDYNKNGRKGNGKDWDGSAYYSKHTKDMKQQDVDKKVRGMSPGDTMTVTIDKGDLAGHVLTISKSNTGETIITSDFEQNSWQTYNPSVLKDSTFTVWEGAK